MSLAEPCNMQRLIKIEGDEEMRRKGFTLLELLIVMSIIALLFSIIVPCLIGAKDRALELAAMHVEPDKDGKVLMEIRKLTYRKSSEDIYMVEINPTTKCRIFIRKPYPSGMKLIKRDGQDYIKWRPKVDQIGVHPVTVVFEGEETSERELKIYVFHKKLREAERESKSAAD
jgi:prepilin-type N-terminal cleavage/methylation domain-containing protein